MVDEYNDYLDKSLYGEDYEEDYDESLSDEYDEDYDDYPIFDGDWDY